MTTTDLIIIGAGPGGYRAAEYAAKKGLKVAIFEGAEVGGTCLNVGCIPTKTYVHSTTFEEARERMATVVPQLRAGVEGILSHPNITLVREKAVFVDAHTVNAQPLPSLVGNCEAGAIGERSDGGTKSGQGVGSVSYTAPNIIIATGSATKLIPVEGLDDPRVVDSTGLLQLDTLPKRLCIIGAGVIGMEFASVFHRFGSEVTVIEFLKECLPALDSDIAKRLRKYLEKQGITFKMKTAVQNLHDIDADVILMATGRKPRVQDDFALAGFEYDERKGIAVNENFETTVKGIYAIGDVNGRQMLAHAAEMQAVRAVNHILGEADGIRFDIMPAAIFTEPEAACVGPTDDQLKEQGIPYVCKKAFWRANGKALAMNEGEGLLKLFVSQADDRILGCHAYGAHSADIVQEVSALMCRDTTVGQLRDIVHIHPTLGEILLAAAEA
ncbi:MAG: NAD(P)/FAD-dependent oxidoreductase [Prevotella sp.]|nr:NAD(P)/FAD-dependent oxidoreductase [Prevotella sp.]